MTLLREIFLCAFFIVFGLIGAFLFLLVMIGYLIFDNCAGLFRRRHYSFFVA